MKQGGGPKRKNRGGAVQFLSSWKNLVYSFAGPVYVWTLACLGWIRPPLTGCLLAWRNLYWFCLFNLTRRALAWRLSSTKEPKKTLSMIRLKVDTSVRGRFSCEKISWSWHFWLAPDSLSWLCFSCERFSCCWKDCLKRPSTSSSFVFILLTYICSNACNIELSFIFCEYLVRSKPLYYYLVGL